MANIFFCLVKENYRVGRATFACLAVRGALRLMDGACICTNNVLFQIDTRNKVNEGSREIEIETEVKRDRKKWEKKNKQTHKTSSKDMQLWSEIDLNVFTL